MGCGSSSSYVIHVEPPRDDVSSSDDKVVEAPAVEAPAEDQAAKATKTSYGWLLDTWISLTFIFGRFSYNMIWYVNISISVPIHFQ